MFAPFLEAFLTGNQHVRTTGIVGTCRADHSRNISPIMHEDILRGNDVATTVRSDVGVVSKGVKDFSKEMEYEWADQL